MIIKINAKKALISILQEFVIIGATLFISGLFLFDCLLFYLWLGYVGIFTICVIFGNYAFLSIVWKLNENDKK